MFVSVSTYEPRLLQQSLVAIEIYEAQNDDLVDNISEVLHKFSLQCI